ncbi:hypothetical protein RJ640_014760 [Escallonia rubra]|uniref:CST complex subunit TEN1 n=1 Tax=Escallonia rubra TaxID=112253 RepID=A0AA88RSU9_9ASTE|nr:hypothetical protein RJ640_014760 [Escallonia rubra]
MVYYYYSLALFSSVLFMEKSLRPDRRLQDYNVEAGIATLADGSATLKIDTQHLHLNLRVGSLYQFIGELFFKPNNEAVLKARVGRNVDGMDLKLYHQSLQLLREFQAEQINGQTP